METSVTYNVFQELRKAQSEIVVTSPYLVPGKDGMALISELRSRQVHVVMMTNSLGATDEPVVHLGYYDYRDPMLDLGVELYEISSSRIKLTMRANLQGTSLGRLHAKLAVVDRKKIFVGSMNLDPRSATINTELGTVITSPQLAEEVLRVIDFDRLQSAYRVRRTPDGKGLEWVVQDNAKEMVLTEEPDSSFWLRLKLRVLSPIIPEALL
jgi:putative cardiolipin synthase